jgi:hypothetical protein
MRHFIISVACLLSFGLSSQTDSSISEILLEADSTISIVQDQLIGADTSYKEGDIALENIIPVFTRVEYNKGFYVSDDHLVTDSLTLLMNNSAINQLWRSQDWDWTIRENSATGGIQYDALNPVIATELDGWHQFSRSYLQMPNYHSASSPRTDLTVLTGIGGGQLFGLRAMSPVDSAKQLWVDYLRMNALGLYRNEGTDGHDLNIKMRQDGVYKDGELMLPLHGFEFSYFSSRSGQNGGLNTPDLFESNVPALRRNLSVNDSRGELYEERLRFMYYRHLDDFTVKTQLKSSSWSVQNDVQQSEYYWDSTGVLPELVNRTLQYNDSVRLTSAEIALHYERRYGLTNRVYYAVNAHAGIESLTSNSGGWDAFRIDSSHVTDAFDIRVQPYVRAEGIFAFQMQDLLSYRGNYKLNVLGFNAGGYDMRNGLTLLNVPGKFTIGLNFLNQSRMYRFEQLYGYSYDLRNVDVPYIKNEISLNWEQGDIWKKLLVLQGAQIRGMRYLESFDLLATWDGSYARAQLGIASDEEGLNLEMQCYGAYKSSVGGFVTPNWGGFTEVNYRKSIGSRFELKAGTNISVEDAFYTPTYLVGVPIWAMQTDHLAGTYPWATAYFEVRIANFIGAVRVINALEGLTPYTYYAFGSAPRSDRWVQLSARWTLFN